MKAEPMDKKIEQMPLTDEKRPYIVLRFIHIDNKEHEFYTAVNRLTGDRLSGFDHNAPSINDSMTWVKSVIRDIHKKATITRYITSKHFLRELNPC